jgi:predicted O-linked N-acetylglucosamine transferase (SPINDLY family)
MTNRKNRRAAKSGNHTNSLAEPTSEEIGYLVTLFNQGRFSEAEVFARKVTEHYPKFGFGWKCLGTVVKSQERTEESLEYMQRAADLMPEDPEAQSNLGVTLKDLGRYKDAEFCYRLALKIKPDFAEAYNNLGVVLKEFGDLHGAESCYRSAIKLKPNVADVYSNLGALLNEIGCPEDAEACHRTALKLNPGFAKAYYNLGITLKEMDRLTEAEACFLRALEIKPDYADACSNLGVLLFGDMGRLDEAEGYCRRALEIKPGFAEAQSVLLFNINYLANHDPCHQLEEARKYGDIVAKKVRERFSSWRCLSRPERLRVGIVSGDLRNHPVGYFLETVISQIDQSRIELIAYTTDFKVDELTARIKPYFSSWKSLLGLNDEVASNLIHSDGVHVLLDLSGHTGNNRLPVFAWKPAPVQVSWLGYFATTGVAEMDYLLCDEIGVPEEAQKYFTESLWYLPDTRICFSPPEFELPVSETPSLKTGIITFGCFQNIAKIGNAVLTVWAKILHEIPNSRLRLQCKQLGDPSKAATFLCRLQERQIDVSRISLFGDMPRADYLAAHAEVDLILDTFPYPGGTTTCEALWMGVPTVTLAGNTLLERQGASILTAAGLAEFVSATKDEYLAKAVMYSSNPERLATLRSGLRQQVLDSPLFDAPRFARNFEDALWGMWDRWEDTTTLS